MPEESCSSTPTHATALQRGVDKACGRPVKGDARPPRACNVRHRQEVGARPTITNDGVGRIAQGRSSSTTPTRTWAPKLAKEVATKRPNDVRPATGRRPATVLAQGRWLREGIRNVAARCAGRWRSSAASRLRSRQVNTAVLLGHGAVRSKGTSPRSPRWPRSRPRTRKIGEADRPRAFDKVRQGWRDHGRGSPDHGPGASSSPRACSSTKGYIFAVLFVTEPGAHGVRSSTTRRSCFRAGQGFSSLNDLLAAAREGRAVGQAAAAYSREDVDVERLSTLVRQQDPRHVHRGRPSRRRASVTAARRWMQDMAVLTGGSGVRRRRGRAVPGHRRAGSASAGPGGFNRQQGHDDARRRFRADANRHRGPHPPRSVTRSRATRLRLGPREAPGSGSRSSGGRGSA